MLNTNTVGDYKMVVTRLLTNDVARKWGRDAWFTAMHDGSHGRE